MPRLDYSTWEKRGQTDGVHPKTETEIMVTVLDRRTQFTERSPVSRRMEKPEIGVDRQHKSTVKDGGMAP